MNKILKFLNILFNKKNDPAERMVKNEQSLPKFKRVYANCDLPEERHDFTLWDVICIRESELLERLYRHLITANEIIYYCHTYGVSCSVKTIKFGWCRLYLPYDKHDFKFGIYRSGTRYDIREISDLERFLPLYNFINDFVKKASEEYQYDKNL